MDAMNHAQFQHSGALKKLIAAFAEANKAALVVLDMRDVDEPQMRKQFSADKVLYRIGQKQYQTKGFTELQNALLCDPLLDVCSWQSDDWRSCGAIMLGLNRASAHFADPHITVLARGKSVDLSLASIQVAALARSAAEHALYATAAPFFTALPNRSTQKRELNTDSTQNPLTMELAQAVARMVRSADAQTVAAVRSMVPHKNRGNVSAVLLDKLHFGKHLALQVLGHDKSFEQLRGRACVSMQALRRAGNDAMHAGRVIDERRRHKKVVRLLGHTLQVVSYAYAFHRRTVLHLATMGGKAFRKKDPYWTRYNTVLDDVADALPPSQAQAPAQTPEQDYAVATGPGKGPPPRQRQPPGVTPVRPQRKKGPSNQGHTHTRTGSGF